MLSARSLATLIPLVWASLSTSFSLADRTLQFSSTRATGAASRIGRCQAHPSTCFPFKQSSCPDNSCCWSSRSPGACSSVPSVARSRSTTARASAIKLTQATTVDCVRRACCAALPTSVTDQRRHPTLRGGYRYASRELWRHELRVGPRAVSARSCRPADEGSCLVPLRTCLQTINGGNHFRYYQQATTKAYFLEVSVEMDLSSALLRRALQQVAVD